MPSFDLNRPSFELVKVERRSSYILSYSNPSIVNDKVALSSNTDYDAKV